MKITGSVRSILVKRLSESLRERMTLSQFNDACIFLDRWNSAFKVVPYGMFEEPEILTRLNKTEAGIMFKKWLDCETGNIEKDFNKGRKLVRVLKTRMDEYLDTLAFNLPANSLLLIAVSSFFVDYDDNQQFPFRYPVGDETVFNSVLEDIRKYVAAVLFLDLATEQLLQERVLDILVNSDTEGVIDNLIELGLMQT